MDPLSITASAVGIVTFALQAVKLLNDDIQNIKNAPNALRDAQADLNALEPMLTALQDAVKQNLESLTRNRRILLAVENCFDICKSFRQQLRAWSKPDNDGQFTMSGRVRMGLLGQDRIREFRMNLVNCKGTLTLVLVAENFIEPSSDGNLSSMIERSDQQLGEQLAELQARIKELQANPARNEELQSIMKFNHDQTQEQLAHVFTRLKQSEAYSSEVNAEIGIDELHRQFSSLQALKDDVSRMAEALPLKTSVNEQVTKLGDHLLLTKPAIDRDSLVETMGRPAEATCEWLLRQDMFTSWLKADPAFVWLQGNTGKGKTMLSIFLSWELRRQVIGPNTHIIYYFCSKQDEKRNTAAAILRSLLWQLTEIPALAECIAKHLGDHGVPLLSEHEALWKLFAALMLDNECGSVYCVLDGLDELEDGTELWFAKKLLSLFFPGAREPQLNVLRLLLVSRDIPGFRLRGQSALLGLDVDLQNEVEADIGRVVDAELSTVPDWTGFSDDYKVKVRSEVIEKTNGSFVPIRIIMNAILVDRPYSGLLETIQSLPRGLDALYGSTLLGIQEKQQHESPEILRWVAMAFRPLSLQELADAVEGDLDDSAIRATVQRCGAVLELHDNTVIFSHSSFRDYLLRTDSEYAASLDQFDPPQKEIVEQFRIDPQEAHLQVALRCLQLIKESHLQHRALDSKVDWDGAPLLQYAVLYWPHHARGSGDVGKRIFESTSFVLSSAPSLRQNWWRTYVHQRPGQEWEQGEKLSPLHIACRFGIVEWARTLLLEAKSKTLKQIINDHDVNGLTPLAWAAIGGHESVVSLLLDHGADIELQTALYSREGISWMPSTTVKSYVREVQVGDGMWTGRHTPLYRAAYKGHPSVVKLLLERGADVHAHGWARSSPMHAVSIGGSVEVMNLLLLYGGNADVNAEIKNSHTAPLHHAVENGHRELVQILLDRGADIHKRQRYSSAAVLHFAAVKTPDPATVELLLERGAEVNLRDNHNRKPLHCFAMKHSEPEAVKLLLEYGATINSLNSLRRTALDLAIECMCDRCQATSQVLLVHGGALKSPTENGRRNHPELFREGTELVPLPEVAAAQSDAVLTSDNGRSVSMARESSSVDDTSSMADGRSRIKDEVLVGLDNERRSTTERDSKPDEELSAEGGAPTPGDTSMRKRDKFRARVSVLGRKGSSTA